MNIWEWPLEEFLNHNLDTEQAIVLQIICSLFSNKIQGASILEPGAGTGRVGFHLRNLGAQVVLSDLSQNSVAGSKLRFDQADGKLPSGIVQANLLNLPFQTGAFDLVWNSGVMEHFTDDDLRLGLREMGRVSRRFVAVFVPCQHCVPYNIARLLSVDAGTWEWGLEKPKRSLREDFLAAGLDVIDEYEFGQETDIPLYYMRLLPDALASEFRREFAKNRRWQQGISLATIGVKRASYGE